MKEKYKKKDSMSKRKKILIIIGIIILLIGVALVGLYIYGNAQMKKIPGMTFEECLDYTLGDNPDGVITVGIMKNGKAEYTVYGEDGKVMPSELHTYEIGSITKTVTAALIARAISEDKIELDKTIDTYIELPYDNTYPTIEELLTHTSGYKGYYFESPMIGNKLQGKNDFCGITDEMVLNRLAKVDVNEDEYSFKYSNFGYAVLGLVLENVYNEEYTDLVNDFTDDMDMQSTKVSNGQGDLQNYWDWEEGDAYMSAGVLTSNIEDMLKYAQYQIDEEGIFENCHNVLKNINAGSENNRMMGINMDSIGMAWIIDKENNIIWHNGATGDYNCYIGFSPSNGTAVVILSNLKSNYRIPSTVMGVKLMEAL